MKCERCGINEATIHMKNVFNGNVTEYHICEDCAGKEDDINPDPLDKDFSLETLINGLMEDFALYEQYGEDAQKMKPRREKQCSFCGLTYPEFKKYGQAGCDHCYTAFRDEMNGILKKINGSSKHVGKMLLELRASERETNAIKLKEIELETAILEENYERAAVLRDEIKDLRENIGKED